MTQMMLILALAVTVEGLVQYAKCIIDMIVKKEYKTNITQLAALVVSIVLCLLAGADIYATFGITFIGGWVGMVLTGVLASRGANYAADAIKRLQNAVQGKADQENTK